MLVVSDYDLVSKCLQGEQDSFTELVARYKKMIYSVVSYYIKDTEEVNDIAQEVFLKIYKSLGSYNPQFKFSTWSVKITKNFCLDMLRKKKVNLVSIDEYENLSAGETPEARYLSKEKRQEIRSAIEMLPLKYRQLIVMYHQKGMSYKEMSDVLNKPMSIIKNRLYRARVNLRESLTSAGSF